MKNGRANQIPNRIEFDAGMKRNKFPQQFLIFKISAECNYFSKWKAKGKFRGVSLANVIRLIYKQRGKDYVGYIDEIPYRR